MKEEKQIKTKLKLKFLGSLKFALLTLFLLATYIIVATFLELKEVLLNPYNSFFFKFLWFAFISNLIFNLFKKSLFKKSPIFIIHFSFIFIFLGASLTHFFSYEGVMHLRSNQTSNRIFSSFDKIEIMQGTQNKEILKEPKKGMRFGFKDLNFKILQVYENADFVYKQAQNGDKILELYAIEDDENLVLKNEEIESFKPLKAYDLNLNEIEFPKSLKTDLIYEFKNRKYIVKNSFESAKLLLQDQASKEANRALQIEVSINDFKKEFFIFQDEVKSFEIEKQSFSFYYGINFYTLPFKVNLKEFRVENYLGSQMPSNYRSFIQIDGEDYEISMNKFLDYKGFRIFQSSFDENGTILSFNRDFGKLPTYFGYFLLSFGLIANLFYKNSRFFKLFISLKSSKIVFITLLIFTTNYLNAQESFKTHAQNLGKVVVQGSDGRLKPFDTTARELLNKIYGKDSFKGKSADETILEMMIKNFKDEPILKVKNYEIRRILQSDKTLFSFNDFFDENEDYRLQEAYRSAFEKSLQNQTKFDKEVLKISEKITILRLIFLAEPLRIFPNKDGVFLSPIIAFNMMQKSELKIIKSLTDDYFSALLEEDFEGANLALKEIKSYQTTKFTALPSEFKIWLEVSYNKLKINNFLMKFFLINGSLFFGFLIFNLTKQKSLTYIKVFKFEQRVYFFALFVFVVNLILRWIISLHAPWSDSYESLVFIAFMSIFAGAIFSNGFVLALCSILSGTMLFVAHLSFIDTQITNIVPVLNSYYLIIHVFVIISSYGFLSLSFMLSLLILVLIFLMKDGKRNLKTIYELAKIGEICVILGLTFLIIGNLLGAVWANESWGRYWGWDAKESWTLVTILFYSILIHLRMIKRFNNVLVFNSFCALCYFCVLMTYFGVNFYFDGLHSYAKGEVKVAFFGLILFFATLMLIVLNFLKFRKLKTQDQFFP